MLNKLAELIWRKLNKNENFTIFCSACLGGIIYYRLGLKFLTPTMSMFFDEKDFIKFINNPKHYVNDCKLDFIEFDNYPIAMLDDIKLHFNHAKTIEEATRNWNVRSERINWDNIYVIMFDRDGITRDDIIGLKSVDCKKIIVLSSKKENTDIEYVKYIKPNMERPNAITFLDYDVFGFRTFEKRWNFVKWLND